MRSWGRRVDLRTGSLKGQSLFYDLDRARLTLGSVPGIVLNIDLMILCFIDSFTAVLTFPTLKLDLYFGSVTVSSDPLRDDVYFMVSTLLIDGTGTFQVDKRRVMAIRENSDFITAFEVFKPR